MFHETIVLQFGQVCQQFRDNNAFYISDKYYSYAELEEAILNIRKALQSAKQTSRNIGLVTNDDLDTYAAIFAIWFEGYAFVPLHPLQPVERNTEIIEQANVELIFNSKGEMIFNQKKVFNGTCNEPQSTLLTENNFDDSDLAYILFTSGSTGKPKGIPITRGNIAAFIRAFNKTGIVISHNDRCLQCFDLTFDVSIQSFLFPLLSGACVYTIPIGEIKFSYAFQLLDERRLTFGAMVPSMLRFLRPYFNEIYLPDLKYCILTAEASPVQLVDEWSKCVPNAEIFNFYGPTEATIYCTFYKYSRNSENKNLNGILSIGKAMNAILTILVDENNNLIGANQKGELCLSGGQVVREYWKNPIKNQESFFQFNLNGVMRRFYRTGDLCLIDDTGDILYSGRLDSQVKLQGHRIELGEIEFYARKFIKDKNAFVIAFNNKNGHTEIALCIESSEFDTSELMQFLTSHLPHYCIPGRILFSDEAHLNANGKIDRKFYKNLLEASL